MWKKLTEIGDSELTLEEIDILKKKIYKKNILKEEVTEEEEEADEETFLSDLPESIIFGILVKFPVRYLYEDLRLVCKDWRRMISRWDFGNQKFNQTKPEFLIQGPTTSKHQYFKVKSIEMDVEQLDYKLHDFGWLRMGRVRSSCNGMLLVNVPKKIGMLQVMNPVTKHFVTLPECPSGCPHKTCSSVLVCDPCTKQQKVVHIYADGFGFEILTLGCSNNAWKRIPGPWENLFERPFYLDFRSNDPVSINSQVLHWFVRSPQYVISMDVNDEKPIKTYLPNIGEEIDRYKYVLLELGGYLSFVYGVSNTQIDVWILKDFGKQLWFKKHSIVSELIIYTTPNCFVSMDECKNALPDLCKLVPLGGMRKGEVLVFKHGSCDTSGRFYIYDMKHREMKKFKLAIKDLQPLIHHKNSIFHWETTKE